MQLTGHLLGGKVEQADEREYGPARLEVLKPEGLLHGFHVGGHVDVWMSHGDRVESLPPGFETIARTPNSPFAAVANLERNIFGVQFHPEVAHTPRGVEMLRAFLFEGGRVQAELDTGLVCRAKRRFDSTSGRRPLGGVRIVRRVDSSVAAMLVSKAIDDRLTCIFVDNGLLRKDEAESVVHTYRDHFGLKLIHVDAADEFLDALHGVSDPEQKRKIIGRVFIDVFQREADKLNDVGYLVQGTLYPDVIESLSFKGPSAVIKSHHNVGGLPDTLHLELIEPLRLLFKDEVREVGEAMGMPHDLLWRHPFPGPGLAVRCPARSIGRSSTSFARPMRSSWKSYEHRTCTTRSGRRFA